MRDQWEAAALGEIVERVTERNADDVDNVLTVSAEHGLVQQELYFTKRVASKNLANYWRVAPGDYVFNKSYSNGHPYGVIRRNRSSEPGVVSPLYIVMRSASPQLVDGWLDLAFESRIFTDSIAAHLKEGGRAHGALNIRLADFFSTRVPLPPAAVQRRIIDLIHHADGAIVAARDTSETAAKAYGELLRTLFLQGESKPLGEIAEFVNGYPFKPAELDGHGLPVIRIKQLLDPNVTPDRSSAEIPESRHLRDGDLVFSWSGTLAVRLWERGPALLNQHLFRVMEADGICRPWLRFALDASIEALNEQTHGSTMKHITKKKLLVYPVNVPDVEVQRNVASLMQSVVQTFERARAQADAITTARRQVLTSLLSGDHEIPESYDKFLVGQGAG